MYARPAYEMFSRTSYTKEQFIKAVTTSFSVAEVLRRIGLKVTGGNYKAFEVRVQILELDISHFTGQGHLRGKTHNWTPGRPLSEILVENSTYTSTLSLKKRLLKEKLLKNECYICGISSWQGKDLALQLDHINGKHLDHRIENLRILCPNCHTQTNTYGGKNIKRPFETTKEKRKRIKKELDEKYPKKKKQYFCLDCGDPVPKKRNRYCKPCGKLHRTIPKIDWPSIEELERRLETTPYTTLARELGVSDNAIRKHILNKKLACAPTQTRTGTVLRPKDFESFSATNYDMGATNLEYVPSRD